MFILFVLHNKNKKTRLRFLFSEANIIIIIYKKTVIHQNIWAGVGGPNRCLQEDGILKVEVFTSTRALRYSASMSPSIVLSPSAANFRSTVKSTCQCVLFSDMDPQNDEYGSGFRPIKSPNWFQTILLKSRKIIFKSLGSDLKNRISYEKTPQKFAG